MRLLVFLGFAAAQAWGCSCAVSPIGNPPCQSAWQFETVFTGTVLEITEPPFPTSLELARLQRKVRMRITEAFRGLDPKQQEIVIETGRGGGDCGYSFVRGVDYIVYASKNRTGALATGTCHPTRPVENAAEELKYFRMLPLAPATSEIRVTAYDVYRTWAAARLAGARVTIDGPGVHQSATTAADGRHIFSNLPPGDYRVEAWLENHTTDRDILPVKLHSKGCAEVLLPLKLDRKVSGRIFAKDGRPASGVLVEAVPSRPRHENDLPSAADSDTTDAEGRYELRSLPTGDYYLGISLSRTPTSTNPYTRWFYPGTQDPAGAGLVHVSDKPGALQFDLTLPGPQHSRIIQGVVFWPDGRPADRVNIFLEDPRWAWQFSTLAGTDKEGKFSVPALDGTRYRLHATAYSNGPASAEPVQIDPGPDPLTLKLVLTRKGPSPPDQDRSGLDMWRKGFGLR